MYEKQDDKKLTKRCRRSLKLSIVGENYMLFEKSMRVACAEDQMNQSNCSGGVCSINWKPKRPA